MIFRGQGVMLGRVRGIEVRAQGSWFVVVALIVWSFWARFTTHGYGGPEAFLMAVAGAALFVGSLMAHELAHGVVTTRSLLARLGRLEELDGRGSRAPGWQHSGWRGRR